MRRRPSTPSVTLFPFLAVLVCAMGSLILLLLVTTRRIRQQVEERAAPAAQVAVVPAASAGEDPAAKAYADALAEREQEIQKRLTAHQQQLAAHEKEAEKLRAQWQANLHSVSDQNQELMRQAIQLRRQIDAQAAAADQADAEKQKLAALIAASVSHNAEIHQGETDLQQQAMALLQQRQQLTEQIQSRKLEQALRKPVYEIVAHDGNSGTNRRPILIECRADSLIFASEEVSISARTLNEFSPNRNPLLAGAEALLTYWRLKDASSSEKQPQPYVLLVVRPAGTVGFYVARRYLESLNQEFGYELVPENAEIQWPAADPQAVDVCRTAVERAMQENRSLADRLPLGFGNGDGGSDRTPTTPRGLSRGMFGGNRNTGSGDPGAGNGREQGENPREAEERIVGKNGEFSLPEVEELRNSQPGDSIDMLGPEWSPNRRRLSSSRAPGAGESGLPLQDEPSPNDYYDPKRGMPGNPQQSYASPERTQDSATMANAAARGARGSGLNAREFPNQFNPQGATGFDAPPQGTGASGGSPGRESPSRSESGLPSTPFAQTSKGMPNDGGAERKWGKAPPNGAIGIEREIVLHLYPDRLNIVDGPTAMIPVDMGRAEFHEMVAAVLQTQALSWGEPPSKFMWRPRLKIDIHPGGNLHYARLKELIEHWGLSSKIEHVLD